MKYKLGYDPFDHFDPLDGDTDFWPLHSESMQIAWGARHLITGLRKRWESASIREYANALQDKVQTYFEVEERNAIATIINDRRFDLLLPSKTPVGYSLKLEARDDYRFNHRENTSEAVALSEAIEIHGLPSSRWFASVEKHEPYAVLSLYLVAEFCFRTKHRWSLTTKSYEPLISQQYETVDYIGFAHTLIEARESLSKAEQYFEEKFLEEEYQEQIAQLRTDAVALTEKQETEIRKKVEQDFQKRERAERDARALQLAKRQKAIQKASAGKS